MNLINVLTNNVPKGITFLKESNSINDQIKNLEEYKALLTDEGKSIVDNDIKYLKYGIKGEESLKYSLKTAYTPMYVIQDLYLEHNGLNAQIDYMLITESKIILIECKNLYGNIEVDSEGNFVRIINKNGKFEKTGLTNPITQNNRHKDLIVQMKKDEQNMVQQFLSKDYDKKIETVVVLANPDTYLNVKFAKKDVKSKIIRSDKLVDYIKNLNNKAEYKMNKSQMEDIANYFLEKDTKERNEYTKKYDKYLLSNNESDTASSCEEDLIEKGNISIESTSLESEIYNQSSDKVIDVKSVESKLKNWRKNEAINQGVPAYMIFDNKTLDSILEVMPKSKDDLFKVVGFGKVKIEKYGDDLLNIISNN